VGKQAQGPPGRIAQKRRRGSEHGRDAQDTKKGERLGKDRNQKALEVRNRDERGQPVPDNLTLSLKCAPEMGVRRTDRVSKGKERTRHNSKKRTKGVEQGTVEQRAVWGNMLEGKKIGQRGGGPCGSEKMGGKVNRNR